jgi:branched-chain amino acid transport system ATP-binding protein
MSILTLENVGVSYRGMRALGDVTLSVERGEMIGVAGPNGAGKTSLLRAIASLVPIDSGRISFDDGIIADTASRRKAAVRQVVRRGMSLVPEGRRLFAGLTVEDHLRFGAYVVAAADVPATMERVYAIFPKLKERRLQEVSSLSGGEKQMVAIARAMMAKPKLLMIDELSLGLAPVVVNELVNALVKLNADSGLTIVLVDECLGRLGSAVSRVLFLSHGHIQAIRSPQEIQQQAAKLYLGSDAG